MATWPAKTDYATGDVLSATNMNDIGNGLNDLYGESFTNNFYAGKNKIINGDFGIWQRGTTFTGITSGTFTADRYDSVLTTSTCNVSQQTFTAGTAPVSGYEANYFIRHVVTTGGTAGSRYLFQQKIEDVRTFAGQTITLSFWAKADSAKNISPEAIQFFGSGGSTTVTVATSKQAITTSWARYNFTIAIPSISGKTLGANSYLAIAFWLDAGSDFNARTNSLGNQSGTFDFWGIQVEAGSTATPFQTATGNKQAELAACQRYYYRSTSSAGSQTSTGISGITNSTTNLVGYFNPPVPMRVTPTAVEFSSIGTQTTGSGLTAISAVAIVNESTNSSVSLNLTSSGFTANLFGLVRGTTGTGYIGFSAEL